MRGACRLCLLVTLVLGSVTVAHAQGACSQPEVEQDCEEGRAEALADLRSGQAKWFVWGLVDEFVSPVYSRLVRERLGVRVAWMGDIVWPDRYPRTVGYNEVVEAHVAGIHGPGAFGDLWDEAASRFAGRDLLNREVVVDVDPPDGVRPGTVFVSFYIAPTGEPVELVVMRSPDSALDATALEAASRLRFEPAQNMAEGERWGRYTVPVRFKAGAED